MPFKSEELIRSNSPFCKAPMKLVGTVKRPE